eukprot:TRINITY_DN32430_c0_g1_i1.p1 TRINITY_DN32430_c0_g1~~TRINITY_DN32430_c0_g1_i1.p1  ORF type:complete len:400 (-),score=21.82 TRINITY_DN32430_c0_g1_i1:1304-2503(-)
MVGAGYNTGNQGYSARGDNLQGSDCLLARTRDPLRSSKAVPARPSSRAEGCSVYGAHEDAGSYRQPSNLESFIDNTTPTVPLQQFPRSKAMRATTWNVETASVAYFSLQDLWEAYSEWSVYGRGVPLTLNHSEKVVQYYVPYLSALQIFTRCDDVDVNEEDKDSSSETSEGDGDMIFPFLGSDSGSDATSAEDEGEAAARRWGKHCRDCGERQVVVDFLAEGSPYGRVPLSDKIVELEAQYPALKSLRSSDLHPSSWYCIAWYPVYRIPSGPTNDLTASFLTYHSPASPVRCGPAPCESCLKNLWMCVSKPVSQQSAKEASQKLVQPVVKRAQTARLQPFALATYRLKGPAWSPHLMKPSERDRINALLSHAEKWLLQQRVHHPDFTFFRSHDMDGRVY